MNIHQDNEIAQQAVQDVEGSAFAEQLKHLEIVAYPVTQACYNTQPSETQKRGVNFMHHRESVCQHGQYGGMICDDLGMGKTLLVLAFIMERLRTRPGQKTLVVASSIVAYEWINQGMLHLVPGTLRIASYLGTSRTIPAWDSFDVLVTTYGVVRSEYHSDRIRLGNNTFSHWVRKRREKREESIFAQVFDRIILDEAHNIRNHTSAQHEAVCSLHGEYHWCISGTLVWNSIDDLFAIFKFLGAHPYCNRDAFQEFVSVRMSWAPTTTVTMLRGFILPLEIRRTKEELALPMLTETTMAVELNENERLFYDALRSFSQDTVQRLFRVEAGLRTTGWARAHTTLGQRAKQCILSAILRMRQSCVHPQMAINACKMWGGGTRLQEPRLLEDAARRLTSLLASRQDPTSQEECIICYTDPPDVCIIPCGHPFCETCTAKLFALHENLATCPTCRGPIEDYKAIHEAISERSAAAAAETHDDDIVVDWEWDPCSSKIKALIDDFQNRRARDPTTKVLVFSQWRVVLDCVKKVFDRHGIRSLRVDGTVAAKVRSERQTEFNSDASINAMLCSLNCCSEGINLQGANVVYIMDPWWTDAKEKQAGNRAHRVGQTRDVEIIHLIAKNTIEDKIIEMQKRKRNMVDATNGTRSINPDLWRSRILLLMEIDEE